MFGFGRKGRWIETGTSRQSGDGENIWVEGPMREKFVDPSETGPTLYDEHLEKAAEATSNDEVIYRESPMSEDAYALQDQLIDEAKREWAKKVDSKENRSSRQERERHNDAKGGEKIGAFVAGNDNGEDTAKKEQDIIRSIDEMAA